MKTDKKHIGELLEKFMSGETTIDEESILGEYFRTSKDIPAEWEAYRMMFAWFDDGMKKEPELRPQFAHKQQMPQTKANLLKLKLSWWLPAACVALLFIVVGGWLKFGGNARMADDSPKAIANNITTRVTPSSLQSATGTTSPNPSISSQVVPDKASGSGNSQRTATRKCFLANSIKPSGERKPTATVQSAETEAEKTQAAPIDDKAKNGSADTDGKAHYRFYNDEMLMTPVYYYTVTKLQDNEYDTILYAVYYHES